MSRTIAQWATAERRLAPNAPRGSRYNLESTPYVREVMAAFDDPTCETVVWVTASQMGKTELIFAVAGHNIMDGEQLDMLYVGPTEKQVRQIAKKRVAQMIESTAALDQLHHKNRYDSLSEKTFGGGVTWRFAHAGSATELSSTPCGIVLVDELSRMEADTDGEGSPLQLAIARTKNFPQRKIGIFSSPTIRGVCPTWAQFLMGTREVWRYTCRECSDTFIPDRSTLIFDEQASPTEARLQAGVACTACGYLYPGEEIRRLTGTHVPHDVDADGVLYPRADRPENSTRSFWTPGLVSPFRSPGQIAEQLAKARMADAETVQAVINTELGEVFYVEGDRVGWQSVLDLVEPYKPGTLPVGVQLITAGVDVSKDRLYYVLRGWGWLAESWGLGHGILWGDTSYHQVWIRLAGLLEQRVGELPVRGVFVDSGYKPGAERLNSHIVYDVCRSRPAWYPAKGLATAAKPLNTTLVDVRLRRTMKTGVELQLVDTGHFKGWLYDRLRLPADADGRWHCHELTDEDYARQVTAEQYVPDRRGGRWIKLAPNHYLDCEILATAAAVKFGLHELPPPPSSRPAGPAPPARKVHDPAVKRRGLFD